MVQLVEFEAGRCLVHCKAAALPLLLVLASCTIGMRVCHAIPEPHVGWFA
jgi:hypothetical protein